MKSTNIKTQQLREFDQIKKLATGKNSKRLSTKISLVDEDLPKPAIHGDVKIIHVRDPKTGEVRVRTESLFQGKPLCSYLETPLQEYSKFTFDDFIAGESLQKIKRYVIAFAKKYEKSGGAGLYLYSESPGSGKTMLSCIIASEITRRHNRTSQAISVIDILRRIRETYNTDTSERSILNPMMSADVLLLDEIGAEKRSDFSEETLYEVIDYRMTQKKTTLFTSNVNIPDLPYHARLISRIRSMTLPVKMPDVDVRFRIAERRDLKLKQVLTE